MKTIVRIFILVISIFAFVSGASAEVEQGCTQKCSEWSACFNGVQSRSCTVTSSVPGRLCIPKIKRVCGTCLPDHYKCASGSSADNKQGSDSWTWTCKGDGEGSDSKCSQSFPTCKYTCDDWSSCSSGYQNRNCTISNKPCIEGKPAITKKVCGTGDIACDPDIVRRGWVSVSIPVKEWRDGVFGNGKFLIYTTRNIITSVDGKTWSMQDNDCAIQSIIFAEGKFIGSCQGYINNSKQLKTYLMMSTDGINWQYKAVDRLNKLAYGDGLFVSTGGLTSKNGYDWTQHTDPYSRTYINDITYGNGIFIMSGGGMVMTSRDGINWQSHKLMNETLDWDQISYGNGIFFGTERHYGISMYSRDGITWNGTGAGLYGVSYVNGAFLGGTLRSGILASDDGFTWTGETAPQGNVYFGYSKFLYGNGIYVGLGIYDGNTKAGFVAVSEDRYEDCGNLSGDCVAKKGVWQSISAGTRTYVPRYDTARNIASGNGITVAALNGEGCSVNGIPVICILTSSDSFSWKRQFVPLTIKNVTLTRETNYPYEHESANIVNFANGQFYLFGSYSVAKSKDNVTNRPSTFTSKDGVNWVRHQGKIDNADYANTYNAVYGNGIFVATGVTKSLDSLVMISTDGVEWKSKKTSFKLNDIVYGNGVFLSYTVKKISSNQYSYDIMSSTDGLDWKVAKADFPYKWERITFGNGKFVAVSQNSGYKVFSSTDGVEWKVIDSPISCPGGIAYGNGIFVATQYNYFGGCYGPSTMSSVDGIEWVTEDGNSMSLRDVGYANGSFIAIAGDMSPHFFLRREKYVDVDGKCGTSDGKTMSSAPETGLCTNGAIATGMSETSTGWTWKCCSNSCSALKDNLPDCGDMDGKDVNEGAINQNSLGLCNSGQVIDFRLDGDKYLWKCSLGTGTSKQCSAKVIKSKIDGVCGASNGKVFASKPATGLCSSGSPTAVRDDAMWYWGCEGSNGGSDASCSAKKGGASCDWTCTAWGACSNGKQTRTCTIADGCPTDNPPDMSRSCSSNGFSCGSSSGESFSSKPTTGLCINSTSLIVVDGGRNWYWICKDNNSDDALLCSARNVSKVDGECGTSNGKSFTSIPTTGLCESGVASPVYGSGPWIWLCNGVGGGKLSVCFSLKSN